MVYLVCSGRAPRPIVAALLERVRPGPDLRADRHVRLDLLLEDKIYAIVRRGDFLPEVLGQTHLDRLHIRQVGRQLCRPARLVAGCRVAGVGDTAALEPVGVNRVAGIRIDELASVVPDVPFVRVIVIEVRFRVALDRHACSFERSDIGVDRLTDPVVCSLVPQVRDTGTTDRHDCRACWSSRRIRPRRAGVSFGPLGSDNPAAGPPAANDRHRVGVVGWIVFCGLAVDGRVRRC